MQPSETVPEWVKNAKVGDKVMCAREGPWKNFDGPPLPDPVPAKGDIVTIAEIVEHKGAIFLRLLEFAGPSFFMAKSFRPLTVRPTDISVFTEMLKTTPANTTVPAAEQVPA